jgi:hypothetical protein
MLCNVWNQQYRNIIQTDHIWIGGDIHAYWISDISEKLTTKLVVAKGREKVSKGENNILIYRVDHKRLKEVDDTEQYTHVYEVKIGDRFAALENSDDSRDISRAWENVRKNVKSLAECGSSISHRPWYDKGSDL